MRRASAFSLIELLVVIAIIAILAAIIFPVYSRAKDSAFRSGDMSRMNELRTALGLYYSDFGAYPPQLLGYVTLYSSGPQMGQIIPADQLQSYLYKKRVGALTTFIPAYNKSRYDETTTAVYPNQDPDGVGTDPIGDLNGDGIKDGADDTALARQAYGPGDGNVCYGGGVFGSCATGVAAEFYRVSGYDVADTKITGGSTRPELRYTLFWTGYALDTDGDGIPGSGLDDPRQLGYGFPPDDTIITWNSYFRELDSNFVPRPFNRDIVLFVSGSARPADSYTLFNESWRYQVKP